MLSRSLRAYFFLVIQVIVMGLLFLDSSILSAAFSTIQNQFSSSSVETQWMINSYILSTSIFIALAGKFADLFGTRKIFCLGTTLFAIASFFCAISKTTGFLIGSRFIQGVGSAMILPSSLSLLCTFFPSSERIKMLAVVGATNTFFLLLGPFLGGVFIQYLSWPYIFYINIPLALVAVIVALSMTSVSPKLKEPLDIWGFLTFASGAFSLVLALMQGKDWGWTSFPIAGLFLVFLLCLITIYFISKKVKSPFIDFSLFKNHLFLCSLIVIFLCSLVAMINIFWMIYFQIVLGFSSFMAGIITLAMVIPAMILSPSVVFFIEKLGTKKLMTFGMSLLLFAFLWMAIFITQEEVNFLYPALIIFGFGYALAMSGAYSSAMHSVEVSKRGIGGGLLSTFGYTGSTLGVAILGSILVNVQYYEFSSLLMAKRAVRSLDPQQFEGLLSNTPSALNALKALPTILQEYVLKSFRDSYSLGMLFSNLTAAILVAFGLVAIFWLISERNAKVEGH